jgi:mannose-1-phosphate guanylyltransferase/mannose-6-phosphate isomerase
MAGNRTLFQEAVVRTAPLADPGGGVVVVGGIDHRRLILEQLAEINIEAHVLLEPEGRDSAAAMATAAAWIARRNPDALAVFVASDHHVPDHDAFRSAVLTAADAAARGRIVTLGVRPTAPSSAYGYIQPSGRDLARVTAFVEKPSASTAQLYCDAGYLWNSGNFIVPAATILSELSALAPLIHAAAISALPQDDGGQVSILGPAFREAPKISIDYAIMEKTDLADVLPVDFAWSDLGSWDAMAGSGEGNVGLHVLEDSEGCVVRAPDGVLIAALGIRNLAIVVEADAVLVADLSRAQDVKRVVERVKAISPRHADFSGAEPEPLHAGARRLADWLRLRALPLWSTVGLQEKSGFAEALSFDGRLQAIPSRSLIQSRQAFVYATAGRWGWRGPWREAVSCGIQTLSDRFLRENGTSRALVDVDGAVLDDTARLYDHAFVLLACAAARSAGVVLTEVQDRAFRLRDHLLAGRLTQGGFREAGSNPYQANAQMHLLEAALAWEECADDAAWSQIADEVVALAETRLIDPVSGLLREFFDEDWNPAQGETGTLVEPGHQFEWAWLLARHARSRGSMTRLDLARSLYARGMLGVSATSGVAQDALNDDGSLRSARARLWPQTEWLKAALLLAEHAEARERDRLVSDAATALRALWLYLSPDGVWRDKRLPSGGFIDEAVPASSLYHIMSGFDQLAVLGVSDRFPDLAPLSLE